MSIPGRARAATLTRPARAEGRGGTDSTHLPPLVGSRPGQHRTRADVEGVVVWDSSGDTALVAVLIATVLVLLISIGRKDGSK